MAKRIKIGLLFNDSKNWIAGNYYLLNIIKVMNFLDVEKQPIVTVISRDKKVYFEAKKSGYKHLKYYNLNKSKRNLIEAVFNKVFKLFFNKDIILKMLKPNKIDILFPGTFDYFFDKIKKQIFWIPDFQHLIYPEYFSEKEWTDRNNFIEKIIQTNSPIILSSESAYNDFKNNFKNAKNHIFKLPFSVVHDNLSGLNINDILNKYGIKKPYFLCSNQLWQHKNHQIILETVKQINKEGKTVSIIFTGSLNDYRNPEYSEKILEEAKNIPGINVLGFIDRKEQLILLKEAKAIIQPSLFEGWNTSIEDAKYFNKIIIASDIAVHREQANENTILFNPYDVFDLKKIILNPENFKFVTRCDYQKNILEFSENIYKIFKEISD